MEGFDWFFLSGEMIEIWFMLINLLSKLTLILFKTQT